MARPYGSSPSFRPRKTGSMLVGRRATPAGCRAADRITAGTVEAGESHDTLSYPCAPNFRQKGCLDLRLPRLPPASLWPSPRPRASLDRESHHQFAAAATKSNKNRGVNLRRSGCLPSLQIARLQIAQHAFGCGAAMLNATEGTAGLDFNGRPFIAAWEARQARLPVPRGQFRGACFRRVANQPRQRFPPGARSEMFLESVASPVSGAGATPKRVERA